MLKYNDTVRNTEDKGENRGRYIYNNKCKNIRNVYPKK